MNDLLRLKGEFKQKRNLNQPGAPELPAGKQVDSQHVRNLAADLLSAGTYWNQHNVLGLRKLLISVYYRDVIAKSNRISRLLTERGKQANDSVVGAKFANASALSDITARKHVIAHYISKEAIDVTIANLEECARVLDSSFAGTINSDQLSRVNKKDIILPPTSLSKSAFSAIIKDAYYVEKFDIERETRNVDDWAVVSIYETELDTDEILKKLNIADNATLSFDKTTLRLNVGQYLTLREKAPYLIAMAVEDISELSSADCDFKPMEPITIQPPKNEPTVGVIDTLFDKSVYFADWVEYEERLPEGIEPQTIDYVHGTGVTSLIVDGPAFNPQLEDGCGNFKVKHFGVATNGKFSSYQVLKEIEQIVANNRDIKVWNLSLGSDLEINPNFISPEAAILDRLQYDYEDVMFVVAGTNDKTDTEGSRKIGAPADSINSLVVNAVGFDNQPASYTRTGPVLSFFGKPDVSYYGGDGAQRIRVCSPTGERLVTGTSYAAPWITRKVAYLMYVMQLSRETTKALIIDSAIGWKEKNASFDTLGYGIVPKRIEDVLQSKDDEIRFTFSGISEQFDTYAYNIPLPVVKGKQPFLARATLCYFPKCSRSQGVDYTCTELDLHFGRLTESGIKSLDSNTQCDEGIHYLREGNARRLYRKWDNVKHIGDVIKSRQSPRKVYNEKGFWGISLKTKERLGKKYGKGLSFGVVVTLKEINGVNRIGDFIQLCQLHQWIVHTVNIENRIDIYQLAEEEITFDE